MGRKIVFLMSLFFLLLVTNVIIAFKLISQRTKYITNKAILEEIAAASIPPNQFTQTVAPLVFGSVEAKTITADARSSNLKSFFRKHNSPLYDQAELLVQTSDKYGIDYRLLPAIAMQESNLCNVIPENSYNCWGWGIWPGHVTRFDDYPQAIEAVAKGIKSDYIDQGLITATQIMAKYNPSSTGSWAHGVNHFLEALE